MAAADDWARQHEAEWVRIDAKLRGLAARRAALDADEARLLRYAEALKLWRGWGFGSMVEYMERAMGYAPHTASERLRVARALADLPLLEDALERGELAHSAVRELSRVAVPDTEAAWLEVAEGKCLRQIEAMVSGHRPGDLPDDPTDPRLHRRTITLELSPESYDLWRKLHALAAEEHGQRLSDDELIPALFRRAYGDGRPARRTDASGPEAPDTAAVSANTAAVCTNTAAVCTNAVAASADTAAASTNTAAACTNAVAASADTAAASMSAAPASTNAVAAAVHIAAIHRIPPGPVSIGADIAAVSASAAAVHSCSVYNSADIASASTDAAVVGIATAAAKELDSATAMPPGASAAPAPRASTAPSSPAYKIALKQCPDCKRGWQYTGGRDIEVDPAVLELAACDAVHLGSLDSAVPERATTTVTPRKREQVLARDGHCCTVPGCRRNVGLDLHHIEYQSRGGDHGLSNLTTLCDLHHRAVHFEKLAIRGEAPDRLTFEFRKPRDRWNVTDDDPPRAGPTPAGGAITPASASRVSCPT